jgi:hypothetical protein
MKEESLLYQVHKSANGHWYVINARGDYEIACDCRHQAEEFAREMIEHANRIVPSK